MRIHKRYLTFALMLAALHGTFRTALGLATICQAYCDICKLIYLEAPSVGAVNSLIEILATSPPTVGIRFI